MSTSAAARSRTSAKPGTLSGAVTRDDRRPHYRISADGPQQGVGTTHRVHGPYSFGPYSFIDHWQLPYLIVRLIAEQSQCQKSHALAMRSTPPRDLEPSAPGSLKIWSGVPGDGHAEVAWWLHVD
jgi:hypothetical protein